MRRKEQLYFCKQCINMTFDANTGITCKLTGRIADFDVNCKEFNQNSEAPPSKNTIFFRPSAEEGKRVLGKECEPAFLSHQHLGIAIIGGFFSAIVAAMLWAAISVVFQYQIGFMAIGVGMLVGISVRFFGAGIDKVFGIVGASLALLGCLMGNLFAQVGLISYEEKMPYLDVLVFLDIFPCKWQPCCGRKFCS